MRSFVLLSSLLLGACAMPGQKVERARAVMSSVDKKVSGEITFEQTRQGVKVLAHFEGLKPKSVHGMHVHEFGKCDPPKFESAGGHFNPHDTAHGGPASPEHHPGDFGNVVADSQGRARVEILMRKNKPRGIRPLLDKAVILHVDPDDLHSQPTGNAGDRLACGLIQKN
jgi:superoxide dismutase, Cu-Zn family